jgi:RNA polymerase sigma-70 factor (ECF subfamily)
MAPSFDKTNWPQILRYYDILAAIHPDPIVMLNRMAVLYKIYGAEYTLKEIRNSPFIGEWEKHYLYHSLLGEIYSDTNKKLARDCFERTMQMTKSQAEQKLLRKKIEQLNF